MVRLCVRCWLVCRLGLLLIDKSAFPPVRAGKRLVLIWLCDECR